MGIDAVFIGAADYARNDATGRHARLDVNSASKGKSGALISSGYNGIGKGPEWCRYRCHDRVW